MEHKDQVSRHFSLLSRLSTLPEKIASSHDDLDNLAEFVLYELSHPACFHFTKAAFFIDNPDFNCLRGIAGVSLSEVSEVDDLWQSPDDFSECMKRSSFNKSVRAHRCISVSQMNQEEAMRKLSRKLELEEPGWRNFKTKYGNRGILIFEQSEEAQEAADHITAGASLLAFCPLF